MNQEDLKLLKACNEGIHDLKKSIESNQTMLDIMNALVGDKADKHTQILKDTITQQKDWLQQIKEIKSKLG